MPQLDHLAFLKQVADFGHGVFTRTMFHPERDRRKGLVSWINSNPSFVETISAPNRSPCLHVFTTAGMKHFSAQSRLTGCTSLHGLADIVLLNAYIFEIGTPFLLPHSPERQWIIDGLRVGLVSSRYGFPKFPETFDRLLILPTVRSKYPHPKSDLCFYTPASLVPALFP